MPIDAERRAKLSGLVTALPLEQVQAVKAGVERACGHSYNEVQQHAWGLCSCAETCPPWVDEGFAAAESLATGSKPLDDPFAVEEDPPPDEKLDDVLDETALQMTGLLRGVVVETEEIKSSKDASTGGVFKEIDKKDD